MTNSNFYNWLVDKAIYFIVLNWEYIYLDAIRNYHK